MTKTTIYYANINVNNKERKKRYFNVNMKEMSINSDTKQCRF